MKLRPYQENMKSRIYDEWNKGHKNVLLVLPTGLGKCLAENTPVLMCDGSTKFIQDIQRGEKVMGPDSKPRVVLSTCTGESEMFKIIPNKGDPWVCNDVHVLTLRHTETDEIIDIPLNEYLTKSKNFKHLHKQFRIGVEFESKPIPFNPYLLGLYLAEGSHGHNCITTPEPEIKEYLTNWADLNDTKIRVEQGNNCEMLHFSDYKPAWYKNIIRNLRVYCCSKTDRWIPKEYLTNTRDVRLQVLAGLLDGDGYLTSGCFEIITKYPSLNKDILFLARSLGLAAYSSKKIATIKSIDFEGDYYRIVISGHVDMIPNKVPRKKAQPREQIKDVTNTGFSVEPQGKGKYFGFQLDGDGRFLLGDFTVTHNTVTFCSIAMDFAVTAQNKIPTAIVVHRKELVQQISLTLSQQGVNHNIMSPRSVILGIIAAQRKLLGKQFYDHNAPISVISVDTLNARILKFETWARSIGLWITDEATHLLKDNKWGRAVSYFPNAKGLGVTATPHRLDKKGLGSHVGGVFDVMVEGPGTRWGIENGFLCKYKIAIPKSDFENHLFHTGKGDYTVKEMEDATRASRIVGDAVENYIKYAPGKQAILFAPSISLANDYKEQFIAGGIGAEVLTGNSSDAERLQGMIDFREKKTNILINVDLFDEGLDVPGIEAVILTRPTMSLSKYLQMCLDQETEILTRRGWLRHNEIRKTDIVAAMNIETSTVEWCSIKNLVKRKREDDMFSFNSTNLDFRITSQHDMIVKSRHSKKWVKETIDQSNKRKEGFHVPVSAIENIENTNITDAELHFLGWFLSDGSRRPYKKEECIKIYQASNAKEKIEHIRKTLFNCGFKWFEFDAERKGEFSHYSPMIHFIIPFKKPKRNFNWGKLKGCDHLQKWLDKSIPEIYNTLSSRQLELLLESLNLGDGSKPTNVNWTQRTMNITCGDNKKMAERLQALCVTKGFRCNMKEENRSHLENRKNIFWLHIKKIQTSYVSGKNVKDGVISKKKPYKRARIKKETKRVDEIVWCVENKLGTLFTRRNGKVLITGNCGRGLRPAKDKDYLIIIDHVGNFKKHGAPCEKRHWTLDRIVKRKKQFSLVKICDNCMSPFERKLAECPWCGEPANTRDGRGGRVPPEMVDGDLELIDPMSLREMELASILEDPAKMSKRVAYAAGPAAAAKALKTQSERINVQTQLKKIIAIWAGYRKDEGLSDREIHKAFFIEFNMTIAQALAEPKDEMLLMSEEITKLVTRESMKWTHTTEARA